jgi:hypothetical protein
MATAAQIAANRRNALRSTGPKTAVGRARAARNAAKHGMNQVPRPAEIFEWFRAIMNCSDAIPDDLGDPKTRAALDLAVAEAKLMNVKRAERDFLVSPDVDETIRMPITKRELKLAEKSEEATELMLLRIANTELRGRGREPLTRKALERYRRDAERQRRRALKAWVGLATDEGCDELDYETKPISTCS